MFHHRTQKTVAAVWGNTRNTGEHDEGLQRRSNRVAEKSVRHWETVRKIQKTNRTE